MRLHPAALLALCFLLLTAMGLLINQDKRHELSDQSDYCLMVSLWKQDEAAGIQPVNRAGWPDFRENFDLTCNGFQVANSTPMR